MCKSNVPYSGGPISTTLSFYHEDQKKEQDDSEGAGGRSTHLLLVAYGFSTVSIATIAIRIVRTLPLSENMPPAGKGKGKKTRGGGHFGSALSSKGSHMSSQNRPSRSRNTSPSSTIATSDIAPLSEPSLSYQDVVDKYITGDNAIPHSSTLKTLADELKILKEVNDRQKGRFAGRLEEIRNLIRQKREEGARRIAESDSVIRKRDVSDELRIRKEEKERKKKERLEREDSIRPGSSSGANSKSGGDMGGKGRSSLEGVVVIQKSQHRDLGTIKKKKRKAESPLLEDRSSTASPRKKPRSESAENAPAPAPAIRAPQIVEEYNPVIEDPSIYEIQPVTDDTPPEERKKIYRVAQYPTVDLRPYRAGSPPDEDFSRQKPANQVTLNAFNTMIEPYFRPFTEEDEAFLRERVRHSQTTSVISLTNPQGDRVTPFIMPPLGRRYKEVWAEQDGQTFASPAPQLPPPNEPRGNPEAINDSILETEDISTGPLLSRVLAAMVAEEQAAEVRDGNGALSNGDSPAENLTASASTNIPLMSLDPSLKLPANVKTDYSQLESRLVSELKHLGMLPPTAPDPNWKERADDEVSARLRLLQAQLHKTAVLTGARKARLQELLQPQLAYQEYITIHEDLDKQVEQAYSKRTRNIKAKKKKLPPHLNGAAAAAAAAAAQAAKNAGIGDVAKSLMEKRAKWHNNIGPVFDEDLTRLPKESIFADLAGYIAIEEENLRAAMEEVEQGEEES